MSLSEILQLAMCYNGKLCILSGGGGEESILELKVEMRSDKARWGLVFILWLGLVYVAIARPFDLSGTAYWVLIGFLGAIPLFILRPGGLPLAAGGMLMLCVFLLGGVSTSVAFSGFAGTAFWTLVPALLFGYVLTKTGLGRRLALYIISVFKPTPWGMALAWLTVGIVLSALTPSMTVRISIVMPIALSLIDTLKLKARSPGAVYIAFLAFIGATVPGNGWFTGTLSGPIIYGMLPPEIARDVTWTSYSRGLIVPFSLLTLFLVLYIVLLKRPRSIELPPEVIAAELRQLGPISQREKVSVVVLVGTFLMFVTIPLHNLSTAPICLAATFIFFCLGILEFQDFSVGISWGLLLFNGSMLSLPMVLSEVGIVAWMSPFAKTLLAPIASNVFLFIAVLAVCLYLLRFIDVMGMVSNAILLSLTPVLRDEFGIHPTVIMTLASVNVAFICRHYMSLFALISDNLLKGKGWKESDLSRLGLAYAVTSILAILISVFYWRAIGVA